MVPRRMPASMNRRRFLPSAGLGLAAGPLLGLAFVIALPVAGLALAAWMAASIDSASRISPMKMTSGS